MERNLFVLTLLLAPLFGGNQFVFWAKFSTKNHVLVGQEFSLSPLMVEIEKEGENICIIDVKKVKNISTYDYLKNNKSKLLDCFIKNGVKFYDSSVYNSMLANSSSNLTVIPIRFKVKFETDYASIISLKE